MKHQIFTLLGCSLLLAGCNLYKDYERPSAMNELEGLYRDTTTVEGRMAAEADTISFGNTPWREVFTEPQLQALIEQALAGNIDLQKADLNIKKAEQGLKISRLAYLPTLAFAPQGGLATFDGSKATKTYTLPLAASWELGSWGSLRNSRKQAGVTVLQTKVAKQATQTAIICGVANIYYTLQMLDAQLATTRSTIDLWTRNVEVMEAMRDAGMTNDAAVAQTKANLLELQASVPTLENSIRQAENSLCLLLAQPSHAIDRGPFRADGFPYSTQTGIPVQLLASRPDVRIAELNLASKFYGVNLARSAFYPSLSISGTAGWTNSAGGMVINPARFFTNALASLAQPLFAGGKLRANLRISQYDYEAASLDFTNAVLTAGNEVSNALSDYNTACIRELHRQAEVETLTDALEKTEFLFQNTNSTTYLETLTAQQSLLSAQLSLIDDQFGKVQAAIALYQALGGGRD